MTTTTATTIPAMIPMLLSDDDGFDEVGSCVSENI
jgi:hypothetical protein